MATYVSRPAWELRVRARAVTSARVAVPLGLGLLLGLSVLVRTTELDVGYWVDEGLSVGIADRPLTDIPGTLRLDGSPPLYYMALHFWMAVAGEGEKATHVLSLVCALLTVPLAYWAVHPAFGRRVGFVAAALASLNPFLTTYGQETRMYALVVLLGMVAMGLFLRAYVRDDPPGRRLPILFGLILAADLYTHNWALFFGAALGLAFLALLALAPASERRQRLRDGALGFGLAALLYLPWIPTLLFQAAHTGAPWSQTPHWDSLQEVPHRLLAKNAWLILVVGAWAGIALLLRARGGRRLGPEARAVVVVAIATFGTVLIAFAASQLSPAWATRYMAAALAPTLMLVAAGLAAARGAGLAALIIVGLLWYHYEPLSDKSNVRQVSAAIAPSLAPGDVVVSTQPEQVPVLHHYLPPGLRYATLTGYVKDAGVTDWRDGVERLRATSPQRDLKPILDALPPGRRLVLVTPIIFDMARWGAPWTELVRLRSEEFNQYLTNDTRFRATAIYPPFPRKRGPNPVAATVLLKTR
jgi:mannosyltransferase